MDRKVAYQLYDPEAEAQHTPLKRFWRAQWNLKLRGPACLPFVVRLTWYLQVVGFVISVHDGIDGDLNGAFFWSRTSCCGASGTPAVLPADTCQTRAGVYRPLIEQQYAEGLKAAAAGDAAAAQRQIDLGVRVAAMEASCAAVASGKHLARGGAAEGAPPLAGDCTARDSCEWVS